MNIALQTVIAAKDNEQHELFLSTAARLETAVQHVEKGSWACWPLDALFNGLPKGNSRLLFKCGASLSRAFGRIALFCEDIDITLFRDDLYYNTGTTELEAINSKKHQALIDAICLFCQNYINGPLTDLFYEAATAAILLGRFQLRSDSGDAEKQSLLFSIATTARVSNYIRTAVKMGPGTRLAIAPNTGAIVKLYVADTRKFDGTRSCHQGQPKLNRNETCF